MTTYSDIQNAEAQVEQVKGDYLRRWGWRYTSNTPGAFWMWTRDFADVDARRRAWDDEHGAGKPNGPSVSRPYGIVMGQLDLAVSMTVRCLDEQPELDKEEAA